jgi:hypothetical protein
MKTVIIDHHGQDLESLLDNRRLGELHPESFETAEDRIARGRLLAEQDSYPPFEICQKISELILQS